MTPLFGFGIAKEEHFSALPSKMPENLAFVEIPGELLDDSAVCRKLKSYSVKRHTAVVIRDIVPAYLADAVPFSPLRLKVEFDSKFRTRCETASQIGCRVISAEFNIRRACREKKYRNELVKWLHSIAGILDEYKLKLTLPLHISGETARGELESLVDLQHELFYPGFRYLLHFHWNEPESFELLEKVSSILKFERNFWRLTYRPEPDCILDLSILEKLHPVWNSVLGRMPVFVSIDSGSLRPEQSVLESVSGMIEQFVSNQAQ